MSYFSTPVRISLSDYELEQRAISLHKHMVKHDIRNVHRPMSYAPSSNSRIDSVGASLKYYKTNRINEVLIRPNYIGYPCRIRLTADLLNSKILSMKNDIIYHRLKESLLNSLKSLHVTINWQKIDSLMIECKMTPYVLMGFPEEIHPDFYCSLYHESCQNIPVFKNNHTVENRSDTEIHKMKDFDRFSTEYSYSINEQSLMQEFDDNYHQFISVHNNYLADVNDVSDDMFSYITNNYVDTGAPKLIPIRKLYSKTVNGDIEFYNHNLKASNIGMEKIQSEVVNIGNAYENIGYIRDKMEYWSNTEKVSGVIISPVISSVKKKNIAEGFIVRSDKAIEANYGLKPKSKHAKYLIPKDKIELINRCIEQAKAAKFYNIMNKKNLHNEKMATKYLKRWLSHNQI